MNILEKWKDYTYNRHDIICNQKYADSLPYSFHLSCVYNTFLQFESYVESEESRLVISLICIGHDLIEDARLTYNDVYTKIYEITETPNISRLVSDGIYDCTELKGKNRFERHGLQYVKPLVNNPYGLISKLCDILSNVRFSTMVGSNMVNIYRNEFVEFQLHLNDDYGVYQKIIERLVQKINYELKIYTSKY